MVKLICFDMDGVIFNTKNFWIDLHKELGTLEEGKKLTTQYLHADYHKLVEEVVQRLWKGKPAAPYYNLIKSLKYVPGAKAVFREIKNNDWLTALISSGSIDAARRAQHELGIDYIYANELVIKDNIITGEFVWPIAAGNEKKVQIIQHLCQDLGIEPKDVIYVGDSDTDLHAFQFVGTSIAFNSSSETLQKAATHIIHGKNLKKILPFIHE